MSVTGLRVAGEEQEQEQEQELAAGVAALADLEGGPPFVEGSVRAIGIVNRASKLIRPVTVPSGPTAASPVMCAGPTALHDFMR
jgi:hypothetical protein